MPTATPTTAMSRVDRNWSIVDNPYDVDLFVCANPDVPIETAAVDEAVRLAAAADTLRSLSGTGSFPVMNLDRVVFTPDFHKGSGVPIGTAAHTTGAVIPGMVGNDVGCGMRLDALNIDVADIDPRRLVDVIRHRFFEGGRNIPLTPELRAAVLAEGISAFAAIPDLGGAWDHAARLAPNLSRMHSQPMETGSVNGFEPWIEAAGGVSRDATTGTVGGGNHFVEIQEVAAIADQHLARQWGLHVGQVVIMSHSGSLDLGQRANRRAETLCRKHWPAGLAHPDNGMYPLPLGDPDTEVYLDALGCAANFAAVNRWFLALTLTAAMSDQHPEIAGTPIWDAAHNLAWVNGNDVLHRKGATPADAGDPVIVPGSMGAPSWLLAGHGNPDSFASAAHGAGRAVPRGKARRPAQDVIDMLERFTIVTPVNPEVVHRQDILAKWRNGIAEEAPWAYKTIGPVIETLTDAGITHPVAELRPLLTVKS